MATNTPAAGWTSQPSLLTRFVQNDSKAAAPVAASPSSAPAASAASPVFSASPALPSAPLSSHAAKVAPESLESQINKAAVEAQKFARAIQNDATTSRKAEPLFEQFAALQQAYILEERKYSDRDAQVKAHASTIAELESKLATAKRELEAAIASAPKKDTVLELTRQLAVSKEALKTAEAAQQSQKAIILRLQGELESAQKAATLAAQPAAAAASPESKPGVVKIAGAEVKQAPAEVANIPAQLAALEKLKKEIEADVAKHTKTPDPTGVACNTNATARVGEYNAIAAECVKIQTACEPFYKALNATIQDQTMHPMSERAIIAAAKHTGMTPEDYKKNVIAVWDSALKDNTALRDKTKAEWNKLDVELRVASTYVAWLETGANVKNKGVPSSWQTYSWTGKALESANAKYPFDGRNVQLV